MMITLNLLCGTHNKHITILIARDLQCNYRTFKAYKRSDNYPQLQLHVACPPTINNTRSDPKYFNNCTSCKCKFIDNKTYKPIKSCMNMIYMLKFINVKQDD